MFKQYLAYLKDNPEGYWFKAKLFGWGWTPARPQGWLVLAIFIVLMFGNFFRIDALSRSENSKALEFIIETIALALILILICYKKGEKPRWQWGVPKKYYNNDNDKQ